MHERPSVIRLAFRGRDDYVGEAPEPEARKPMPKFKPVDDPALPSKAQLLAFMTAELEAMRSGRIPTGKIGKREVARAFNITGDARIGLKRMLRDLEVDGALERRGKSLSQAGTLPNMLVVQIVGRERDGELIAAPGP